MSSSGCSIVIPTHNRAHLIARAIESVLGQSYEPLEIIVVDDGSTDGTEAVVARFPSDRVRYLRKTENSGAAESRNRGARAARYPLLTFLDSDDEALPGWLAALTSLLEQPGVGAACCGLEKLDGRAGSRVVHLPSDMGPAFDNAVARFSHGGVFMIRKALFDEVGGYDESLRSGQHTELAIRLMQRLAEQRQAIRSVFQPLVRVHVHGGARIRTNWNALYQGSLAALSKHPQVFAKDPFLTANYLSIAGISRARVRQFGEARKYLGQALVKDPRRPARWGRFLVAHLPWVREQFWKP